MESSSCRIHDHHCTSEQAAISPDGTADWLCTLAAVRRKQKWPIAFTVVEPHLVELHLVELPLVELTAPGIRAPIARVSGPGTMGGHSTSAPLALPAAH